MTGVALVTAKAVVDADLDEDLPLLAAALERIGVPSTLAVWDDPAVDWGAFDVAVVRSPWDYAARRDEFLAWAARTAERTRLLNPPPVLEWSTDKRYLGALAGAGVPTVPTQWFVPGDEPAIGSDGAIVVKPVVGAGAIGAGRFDARDGGQSAARAHAAALLAEGRAVMVQPYLDAIDHAGETAIVYIDGQASHAIAKAAILRPEGQTLVEGGLYAEEQMAPRQATAAELAVADVTLTAARGLLDLSDSLLYARVDLVPGDNGAPVVLELELAEPSLFLAYADAGAADRFAAAIARRSRR